MYTSSGPPTEQMPVIKEKKDGNSLRLPIRSPDFLCTCSTFTVYHIVCRHEHWIADRKLFRRTHCCTTESMTAEETTASTSLLKDCFPGRGLEEVHVLVVDMQAHMSAGLTHVSLLRSSEIVDKPANSSMNLIMMEKSSSIPFAMAAVYICWAAAVAGMDKDKSYARLNTRLKSLCMSERAKLVGYCSRLTFSSLDF